jgi:hypothetical protein
MYIADMLRLFGGGGGGVGGILAGTDFWAGAEPASGADLLLAVVPARADLGQ